MTAAASTLAQRRATLKKLMADPEATFDQYRRIINGATEKERASLARTLNAEKAAASDLPKSIKAYLAAALTAKPARAAQQLHQLTRLTEAGHTDQRREIRDHFMWGTEERRDDWVLEFADQYASTGASLHGQWELSNTILRNRGLSCSTPRYLAMFLANIPPVYDDSPKNHAETTQFFRTNPHCLEQQFWDVFTVEGALRQYPSTWAPRTRRGEPSFGALTRLLSKEFEGVRPRCLTETLQALLRDFGPADSRYFYTAHEGLTPTDTEIIERLPLYTAVLASPYSPAVGMAQTMLRQVVTALTSEQATQLVDASSPVLFRTEKKVLRAHLRLLAQTLTTHPELAERVSQKVAEAVQNMPADIQAQAQQLVVLPSPRTIPPAEPAEPAQLVRIPTIVPQNCAPQGNLTPGPVCDDEDFAQRLIPLLGGEGHGANIPPLLEYLGKHPRVQLNETHLKIVREHNSQWFIPPWVQNIYLTHLILRAHDSESFSKRFDGYVNYLCHDPETGQPMLPHRDYAPSWLETYELYWELTRHDEHHDNYGGTATLINYRGPAALFQEQLNRVGEPHEARWAPLATEPIPAKTFDWYRHVEALEARARPSNESGIYKHAPHDSLMMWLAVGQELNPEGETFENAAVNVMGLLEEFTHRTNDAENYPFTGAIMQWYAWLMQHNPDVLAAQAMPLALAASYQKTVYGLPETLTSLADTHRVLGAPSYSVLGWALGAKTREYRVQAAETVAQLAERGMLDTQLLGEELAYLLKNQWVATNRVVQALKDTASISPLAGWRTLQVLVEVLPVVGRVNRGGVLVQLLAELAGEYGVSVALPESLRPALKGTTLLAKNLRALSALDTHPSGLAEQANQQALALMTKGGA